MTLSRILIFLLGLTAAAAASAQVWQQDAPQASFLDSSPLTKDLAHAMQSLRRDSGATHAKDASGVIVKRSGASSAAKKLAAAYPANARAEVEGVFGMLLAMYPQVEHKLGMPANELGGAVALFLVASVQAYYGRDVQLEQLKSVAAQVRGILRAHPAIAQAPNADKQEVYEQSAIIGMFLDGVHEALQKSPNTQISANMKQAAKGYLERLLGEFDHVDITAQGLVVKVTETASGAVAAPQAPVNAATLDSDDAALAVPSARTAQSPNTETKSAAEPAAKRNERTRRIEAVVLQQAWGVGIGGSMVLRYDPVVLYSDGTFTRDAEAALSADVKVEHGWRKEGADYLISGANGKLVKIAAKMLARPANPRQALSGRYRSFSGLGGGTTGTTMVAAYENFTFAADGTVRIDKGVGASTPTDSNVGPDTSVVTRSSASSAGRYSLDGYRITISISERENKAELFYFFPDSDHAIGIGAGTYSNREKK